MRPKRSTYVHTQMIQNISVMSLLKIAYCKRFFRNSKGKCSPFEVGVLCLTMALIPQRVVTIQNVNCHAFMLTCEDELEDKRRHVSTSISSERPSGPQRLHKWRPRYILHLSSSHHFFGHRLSFLICHRICIFLFPYHFIASFLWAPPVATEFSVFCIVI